MQHRRRGNTVFQNTSAGRAGSEPFSHDGKFLLYRRQIESMKGGIHEAGKLSQAIVYDLDAGREVHCLSGHTDNILWEGFSPDDQHIASSSFDGTIRMYSASTGEFLWATPKSGDGGSRATFSPDSKHIVWGSAGGGPIQVHKIDDGALVSKIPEAYLAWRSWLTWSPNGEQVAFCTAKDAYVWRPFDGAIGSIAQHFKIGADPNPCHGIQLKQVSWMDHGRLLGVQVSDGTNLVYDMHTNAKEAFV